MIRYRAEWVSRVEIRSFEILWSSYQLRGPQCLMYGDGKYQEWLIVGSEFNLPYDSVDLMELEGKVGNTAPHNN